MNDSIEIWDAHVTVGESEFGNMGIDTLLAQMEQFGIRRAVLSPTDRWLAVDNREGNDALLHWVSRFPDQLCGYVTANPWYGKRALDELARGLDAGLSGIKLHPGRQGFALLERLLEPIWSLVNQWNVPVYLVTGISVASTPLQVAELARRYPEIDYVLGRSGRTDYGWLDLMRAIRQVPNIYVETAYNMPSTLRQVIASIGSDRVIFSSDMPNTNLRLELEKLSHLEIEPETRSQIMAQIMGGNLAHLLCQQTNTQAGSFNESL